MTRRTAVGRRVAPQAELDQPAVKSIPEPKAGDGLTREERKARSRERIIQAAITLFAERGYEGVRLDEVSSASGDTRSLILYHFKSKDGLWSACAEIVTGAFNEVLTRNLGRTQPKTDQERIRSNIAAWLDAYQERPELARFLVREGGSHSPRLDFLVQNFAYSKLEFDSAELRERLRADILRDVIMAIFLALAALGPLLETSLSHVAGRAASGVYPLSPNNRERVIEIIMLMIQG